MEMKAEGKYVARGLSFRDAEFHEVFALLTPQQVRRASHGGQQLTAAGPCWRGQCLLR
jgi:hypothetical protein